MAFFIFLRLRESFCATVFSDSAGPARHLAVRKNGDVIVGVLDQRRQAGGVVMLRELMFQEMEKVQRGDDPLGVVRDPNHAIIDTNLDHERGRESAIETETVPWRAPGLENVPEEELATMGYGAPR